MGMALGVAGRFPTDLAEDWLVGSWMLGLKIGRASPGWASENAEKTETKEVTENPYEYRSANDVKFTVENFVM